jgi:hypothetical protein
VCLLPEFLVLKYNVPFYFGGTSLLIIVVVTMDFWAQVQSYVMSQQYESLLKKANFKTSCLSSRCRGRFWRTFPNARSASSWRTVTWCWATSPEDAMHYIRILPGKTRSPSSSRRTI